MWDIDKHIVSPIQFSLFTQPMKWYMRSNSIYMYSSKIKGTFYELIDLVVKNRK